MNVTGMFPAIVCKNVEDALAFAEQELGFSIKHKMHAIISDKEEDPIYIMKNEAGVRFDIVKFDIEKPVYSVCMNVDDFDEGRAAVEKLGWKMQNEPVCVHHAKKALFISDAGLLLLLIQHYRKEDEDMIPVGK